MKFIFRLEFLLRQKTLEEKTAKIGFLESQGLVNVAFENIQKLQEQIRLLREKGEREQKFGGNCSTWLASYDDFINGQKLRIENAKIELRELMVLLEDKKEKLLEVTRERKIIEKMKENKIKEHKKNLKKREQKSVDDLVISRRSF